MLALDIDLSPDGVVRSFRYIEGIMKYAGPLLTHLHIADSFDHRASSGLRYIVNPPGADVRVHQHNEIGNGVMSYSEADRQRFIVWLKAKYGTIANVNQAWATQRWSRHLNSFEEVNLPYANGPSPPERYLDLRDRFDS